MPRRRDNLDALETALHWRFGNRTLLVEALSHASARGSSSNERLEFLGDRVLGLVIAQEMIARYPSETEGLLAPRLNALVCRETCAEIAAELDLGDYISMSRSEALNGGRRKAALLANVTEAVIAAVYLDGGFDAAQKFILHHWSDRLEDQRSAPVDPKTTLQEWTQARGYRLPDYTVIDRSGPDHAPLFTIRVTLANGRNAEAEATSKRLGERACAQAMLDMLESGA